MLTRLTIRRFKRFKSVDIELGSPVVFIGPNNSGKTTALQALALWEIGLRRWNEKRRGKAAPEKRPGVTINRRDLLAVPAPTANLLWQNLHVRDVQKKNGKQETKNICIEVTVAGVSEGRSWACGFEFDYANEESFYCRPLREGAGDTAQRMPVPDAAGAIRVSFLHPMSGLAAKEPRHDPGQLYVLLGEGRTAEVLRNLCYRVCTAEGGKEPWSRLQKRIHDLFHVEVQEPTYVAERGEIEMTYCDRSGARLDLSSAGRGLQQTLLLLAHMALNPRSVLLLDEPDAHLEILRQRQTYHLLADAAREQESQLIIASHSEIVLNEAAERDMVVAFLGRPHRIDDRGVQLGKALREIGFDHYYQAEQVGWVLYLEGSTDLAILQAFARTLDHAAQAELQRPFFVPVTNHPPKARDHFHGLREAKNNIVGLAIFDNFRPPRPLQDRPELRERMWSRREIENYLCQPETLVAWAEASARATAPGPLFASRDVDSRRKVMQDCIEDFVPRVAMRDRANKWWNETKVSDEFLEPLFESFFKKLGLYNEMSKTNFHVLAPHVPLELISSEVREMLDMVVRVAGQARPEGAEE